MALFDPFDVTDPRHPHTIIAVACKLNPGGFEIYWRRDQPPSTDWQGPLNELNPPIWHAGNDYKTHDGSIISRGIPWDFYSNRGLT